MRFRPVFLFALLTLLAAWPALAWEQSKPVGYIQLAEGPSYAVCAQGLRLLEAKAPLYRGELLLLPEGSKAQAILHDGGFLVVAGPTALRLTEFEHEWGNTSAAANQARFELAAGLLRLDMGQILDKNADGLTLDLPAGRVRLDGRIADFEVERPDFAARLASALDGLILEPGAKNPTQAERAAPLLALFDEAMAEPSATQRIACLAGGPAHPLRLALKDGDTVELTPGQGVALRQGAREGLSEASTYAAWSRLERDVKASIPRSYRIMLGEDWGSGGDGGEAEGCGC